MKTYPENTDFLGLTEEQFSRFASACHAVYQSLGGDWAQAGMTSFSRADLIEVVLDADNVREWGVRQGPGRKEWETFYDKHIRPWLTKHYGTPKFNNLMKLVFPYSRYDS